VVFAFVATVGPSHERRNSHAVGLEPRPELGMLVAFMAAVTTELPSHIGPSKPLDPQLVVGLTRVPTAGRGTCGGDLVQ